MLESCTGHAEAACSVTVPVACRQTVRKVYSHEQMRRAGFNSGTVAHVQMLSTSL